jgi:Tol biopolymer transport system component
VTFGPTGQALATDKENEMHAGGKDMNRTTKHRVATWIAAIALLMAATAALVRGQSGTTVVLTPGAPTLVTSPRVTVNNGPGDQVDPHVSGDLACYTADGSPSSVRYFRFPTGPDTAIAGPTVFDLLCDVSGNRIAFTRVTHDRDAIMVFDTATSMLTEVDPRVGSQRLSNAIGGNTVAFIDFGTGVGTGDLFAHDLSSPGPGFGTVQLSAGAGWAQNPGVAPSGNVVVWEQCGSLLNCDVMASVFKPAVNAWSGFTVATAPAGNPDTDDTWIAYDANRAGNASGKDIYFKRVVGDGIERQLAIAGDQNNPGISQGVIAFESSALAATPTDIFVYIIATNALYQITNTPNVNEILNDVSVLPNGDIRVIWMANDGLLGDFNIYATTFTPAKPTQIAFASTRDGNSEIYVMDKDGSNQKRLTSNPAFDGFPAWSPDHTKIAFVSTRDGIPQIYAMNADGSNQTKLSSNLAYDGAPAWSPDGGKIAFHSARGGNFDIYVMNADGTNPTRLTNDPAIDVMPEWSPDGAKIAFATNRAGLLNLEIYVMNADGSNPIRLTNHPAIDFDPTWSPDGRQIAFTSTRDGSLQIYVMNADGSSPTRLTNVPAIQFSQPNWSQGADIAVTGTSLNNTIRQRPVPPDSAIYSINAGGNLTRLSMAPPTSDSSPDW